MALDKLVDSAQLDSDLTSVANAIRAKSGGSSQLAFPAGFVSEVESISSGGITPSGSIEITTNGTYDVTQKASAVVNVPQGTTPTGTKQVSITQNGTTTEDVTNYASVQITTNVPTGGGGQSETSVDLPSVTEETTLKDYLAAHPIPLKYVNEILWVWFYNDNAPSSGGVTKWNQFWVEGNSKITMLSAYSNNNVSANSLGIGGEALSGSTGTYFNIANGAITNSNITNTSRKIAAGTTVKALHIPINYNTLALESTLR